MRLRHLEILSALSSFCYFIPCSENTLKNNSVRVDIRPGGRNALKKQVRRGTYRESENLLRSIDIW